MNVFLHKELSRTTSCLLFLLTFFSPNLGFAERESAGYLVGGKPANKNTYRAALLTSEAVEFIKKGANDRAIGKLKLATVLAPDWSSSHGVLGILYARKGLNDQALVELKLAVKSKDAPAHCFEELATFYQTMGDLDAAIHTYQELQKRFGDDASVQKRTEVILKMLERERERRQKSTGSSKGSDASKTDYLQDALESGFHRWSDKHMPLKVFIDPNGDPEEPEAESDFFPGEKIKKHSARNDNVLKSSFYDWAKALNQKVNFIFVNDSEKADIRCHWTNDPKKLGDGTENGETLVRMAGETLVSAEMNIRERETEGAFPFSENLVTTTCRHEVGHALGLTGHSPNPQDVMFFSVPLADVERKISGRDAATMMKIYSRPMAPQYIVLDFLLKPVNALLAGALAVFLVLFVFALVKSRKSKSKKGKRS